MSYSTVACPKCANMNQSDNKFCGYCGHEITFETICPRCGTARKKKGYGSEGLGISNISVVGLGLGLSRDNKDFFKFCTNCGYDYES